MVEPLSATPGATERVDSDRIPGRLLVSVKSVSKSYGAIAALRDVSLDLAVGEIHALCGHNGAGKSTLIKMLAGLQSPDTGEIQIDGDPGLLGSPRAAQRAGVAIVDQELSILPHLTVLQNLLLGADAAPFWTRRGGDDAWARELLDRVGLDDVDPGARAGSLTIGERQRVEIARALSREARLLVLDEPTATLGEVEIHSVFEAVRSAARAGTTVVFVSHRLGEVLALCDRVSVMRDGQLITSKPVTDVSPEHLVELLVGELPARPEELVHRAPVDGAPVVIEDLSAPPRPQGLSLSIRPGEVVALAGQVGSGTSTALRALAGLVPGTTGRLTIDGESVPLTSPRVALGRGVIFISNDRKSEGLFLHRRVSDNLVALRLGLFARRFSGLLRRSELKRAAADLATMAGLQNRLNDPVGNLSGGNQQKVFIGRSLGLDDARLILLDEPTRGVDVGGRADIHHLVLRAAASGVAVLISSTELDEILDLADRVVTIYEGEIVSIRDRSSVSPEQILAEMTHRGETA